MVVDSPSFTAIARLLAAALAVASMACDGLNEPSLSPTLVVLPDSVELTVGQTVRLDARTFNPARAAVAWTSYDPRVASVDTGLVLALSPGRTVIRAALAADMAVRDSTIVRVQARGGQCPDCPLLLSIQSIADTLGEALDPQALHGTVVVTAAADVSPLSGALDVEFQVDTLRLCSLPVASILAILTCRADLDARAAGVRIFPAGPHTLTVLLRHHDGAVIVSTSLAILVANLAPASLERPLVDIATSGAHTCALADDGTAYCWGNGRDGQLGNGALLASLLPVRVEGPPLVALSAGAGLDSPLPLQPYWSTTCGRTAAGAGYCWGYYWAVGAGTYPCAECGLPPVTVPTPVQGGFSFRSIVVSPYGNQSCGITVTNRVYCWEPRPDTSMVAPALRSARAYAGTLLGACAIDLAGSTLCAGANRFGEAGTPWTGDTVTARAIDFPGGAVLDSLVGSFGNYCGLTSAGEAWCWGRNEEGQLGVGTIEPVCLDRLHNIHGCPDTPAGPRRVLAPRKLVQISAGMLHTCALADDGTAYCWGRGDEGQLGSPGGSTSVPRPVAGALRFSRISARGMTTCGITTGGVAWCWGNNAWGQLGTGDLTPSPVPVRVAGQGTRGA